MKPMSSFGLGEGLFESARAHDAREVEDRPGYRGDGHAVDHGGVLGAQPRDAVRTYAAHMAAVEANVHCHIHRHGRQRQRQQHEDARRGLVAAPRFRTACQDGRDHAGQRGGEGTEEVDAAVQFAEPPRPQPAVDRGGRESGIHQLSASDDGVLSPGQVEQFRFANAAGPGR
jgi:hypothetical protein